MSEGKKHLERKDTRSTLRCFREVVGCVAEINTILLELKGCSKSTTNHVEGLKGRIAQVTTEYYNAGVSARNATKYNRAKRYFLAAKALGPGTFNAAFALAEVLLIEKEYVKCREVLKEILASESGSSEASGELGDSYLSKIPDLSHQDHARAVEFLKRAIATTLSQNSRWFEDHYITLPDIIKSWVDSYVDLAGARVLDFGCGHGITALAMAMRFNARVLGVDVMPDPAECLPRAHAGLGIDALPENLELRQIEPGENFRAGEEFDLIYSWSSFEHISQDIIDRVLDQIKSRLSQNGCLFLQIAPLHYSAEGSHLFHRIPEPWGHIWNQESIYFRKLSESCESDDEVAALWSCFQTLNKLTASDLVELMHQHGFEIIREDKTEDQYQPHPGLEEVICPDVLRTNQIIILARHVS